MDACEGSKRVARYATCWWRLHSCTPTPECRLQSCVIWSSKSISPSHRSSAFSDGYRWYSQFYYHNVVSPLFSFRIQKSVSHLRHILWVVSRFVAVRRVSSFFHFDSPWYTQSSKIQKVRVCFICIQSPPKQAPMRPFRWIAYCTKPQMSLTRMY